MEELLYLLPTDERALKGISRDSLAGLHNLLSWHGSPELRHMAFVALMRLGRQAPTLFRKDDDPAQDATAGVCPQAIYSEVQPCQGICGPTSEVLSGR